jgi:hypothetical protein
MRSDHQRPDGCGHCECRDCEELRFKVKRLAGALQAISITEGSWDKTSLLNIHSGIIKCAKKALSDTGLEPDEQKEK